MSQENYSVELLCDESDTEFDNLSVHSEYSGTNGENKTIDQDELLNIDGDTMSTCCGIKPYNFEPYLSDKQSSSEISETSDCDIDLPSNNIEQDIQRLQNTEWLVIIVYFNN